MSDVGIVYTVGLVGCFIVAFVSVLPELLKAPKRTERLRISLRWEPRDLWIGVYREPATQRTFVCFLPAVVLIIQRESSP